jgi:DNA-binding transcriptional LysR family regulator
MAREQFGDLLAFVTVARERSFTRAAAQLNVSQSALSHTIRALEARLGLRLLARTTRSVAPTEAGERLLNAVGPRFDDIASEVAALSVLRDKPAGNIRINATEHAANTLLWPSLERILPDYPDIHVELIIDNRFIDIVAERYDAGVRIGDDVAKDMIAVRISPEVRMAAVASPAYLAKHPPPKTPYDLADHNCIGLRMSTHGNLYAWEFKKGKREVNVRVQGQLTFNSSPLRLRAALAGFGIANVPQDLAEEYIADGRLVHVLKDWTRIFPGYHLYYPSRRQASPAFNVLVEALRYRGKA